MENNKNYMKGFVPYAIAAAILSLCGGFTASVPTAISTAWDADSSLTFITLAYSWLPPPWRRSWASSAA